MKKKNNKKTNKIVNNNKKINKNKIIILLVFIIGLLFYYYSKPVLYLNGDKVVTVKMGNKYIEKNAFVKQFGKKINEKVVINSNLNLNKSGKYLIKYSVKNNNNIKPITRIVRVIDIIKPTITLKDNDVTIYLNDKYVEPGFKAIDNNDGNITKKVIVKNDIDTSKIGVYNIKYIVTDTSNNKTVKTRKVNVIKKPTSDSIGLEKDGLSILMYHFFYVEDKGQKANDDNWLEVKKFEKQMKFLSDNDYYFPSWEEVYNYVLGKIKLPKKSVVITSDDGNMSFFYYAVPIINKYNVKATSFIVTSWCKENLVKSYASDKIHFESHTNAMHTWGCPEGRNGKILCVNYDEGIKDLKKSVEVAKNNWVIAYPFGAYNDHAIDMVKDVGIKMGVTTDFGKVNPGDDLYKLNRIRISNDYDFEYFVAAVN